MKESLKEKKLLRGRLAKELIDSESYKLAHKKLVEKKDATLKEVLGSKEIGEVRYKAGFIDGLSYLGDLLDQWSREAISVSKKH